MRTQSVLARGVSEGRIVKSVQDQVNSFIEPMKPGIFKFDGKALANIKSINGVLAAQANTVETLTNTPLHKSLRLAKRLIALSLLWLNLCNLGIKWSFFLSHRTLD